MPQAANAIDQAELPLQFALPVLSREGELSWSVALVQMPGQCGGILGRGLIRKRVLGGLRSISVVLWGQSPPQVGFS